MKNIARFFNSLNYVCILSVCFMVLSEIDYCKNAEEQFNLLFNSLLVLMAGQYFRVVSLLILKGEE